VRVAKGMRLDNATK